MCWKQRWVGQGVSQCWSKGRASGRPQPDIPIINLSSVRRNEEMNLYSMEKLSSGSKMDHELSEVNKQKGAVVWHECVWQGSTYTRLRLCFITAHLCWATLERAGGVLSVVLVYDIGFSEMWMLLTKHLVFEILLSKERCPRWQSEFCVDWRSGQFLVICKSRENFHSLISSPAMAPAAALVARSRLFRWKNRIPIVTGY